MGSSLVKVDVHLVFHVKNNKLLMKEEDLPRIFEYVGGIIRNIGAIPIEIGGIDNHIHILTSIPKSTTIADFVRTIKSNSSRWIKTIDTYYETFAWQDGYAMFSVGYNALETVVKYIKNQKRHHTEQSYKTEYTSILDKHNVQYDEKYIFD